MAEVLSLNLESAGLEVEVIRDGVSALVRLDRAPPDAVVLDLGLPEVSGYRVMRVLRHTPGWEAYAGAGGDGVQLRRGRRRDS